MNLKHELNMKRCVVYIDEFVIYVKYMHVFRMDIVHRTSFASSIFVEKKINNIKSA